VAASAHCEPPWNACATSSRSSSRAECETTGAFGEIAGNDEYLQTLEEASVLASRVASLERLLESATVVPGSVAARGIAAVGTTVGVEAVAWGGTRAPPDRRLRAWVRRASRLNYQALDSFTRLSTVPWAETGRKSILSL
jgi:hypothetical protein